MWGEAMRGSGRGGAGTAGHARVPASVSHAPPPARCSPLGAVASLGCVGSWVHLLLPVCHALCAKGGVAVAARPAVPSGTVGGTVAACRRWPCLRACLPLAGAGVHAEPASHARTERTGTQPKADTPPSLAGRQRTCTLRRGSACIVPPCSAQTAPSTPRSGRCEGGEQKVRSGAASHGGGQSHPVLSCAPLGDPRSSLACCRSHT